ncbi:MAG: hypothetical protein JWL69_4663 [Phycisphaerales bacterium]|nr:hypothetical protein [Phycisphaerales bacterium]MDB5357896.1 hypothetical protein [Phycisphaerales bacterium]
MKHPWLALSCTAALSLPLAWASAVETPAAPLGPALPEPKAASVLTTQPAALEPVELGNTYESQSGGVSFRPPASMKVVNALDAKFIAEWSDPQREWTLKLSRIVLEKNTPLTTRRDNLNIKDVDGFLETTVKRLQQAIPGGKLLRQDVTNIRDGGRFDKDHPQAKDNVGMIAIRYSEAGKRRLAQQAIIQSDERIYFLLSFVTPGSSVNDENAPEDPGERQAAELFSKMLDTLRLLDRTAIKQDQDARLYRTRALLVNLTAPKLKAAMRDEQWVRIMKDGKDVGYSCITETNADGIPRALTAEELRAGKKETDLVDSKNGTGILIGVRARMISDGVRSNKTKGPIQSDSSSWFFSSLDRKHEDFSRITVTDDHVAPKKTLVSEAGSSDKRAVRSLDREAFKNRVKGSPDDANQPPVNFQDEYLLNVTLRSGMGDAEPLERKLPPWYVSEAIGHLLPRLLPLNQPKNYMFATYISDVREVMMRYMDVLPEQNVVLAGAHYRAVPIRDRLGLEGPVTTHYLSPEGNYIGSESKDQKIVMLPTTKATLEHIWSDANLTRPDKAEHPAIIQGQPDSTVPGPGARLPVPIEGPR